MDKTLRSRRQSLIPRLLRPPHRLLLQPPRPRNRDRLVIRVRQQPHPTLQNRPLRLPL
ncbi:MAG: hypothetical protein LH679_17035 [Cyanobacteria bacterium CAN_BIN43]|nr:hypothetical protein [Cyanobacteria bacterium CAN_BIN43]